MQPANPLADVVLERQYIRTVYGINRARQYNHLIDDMLRLQPEDCYLDAHRHLLEVFHALVDAKIPIDSAAVRIELERRRPLHAANALEAFELAAKEDGADLGQPGYLAGELKMKARLRRKRESLMRALAYLDAGHEEPAMEHALRAISEETEAHAGEFMSSAAVVQAALKEAEDSKHAGTSLRTGHVVIDRAIGTLRKKTMTIIGGRRGAGKSSLALAWAISQARRGIPVGVISLEDSESVWGERLLAHTSGVNPDALGGDTDHLRDKLEGGIASAGILPIHFAFELNKPCIDVLRAMRTLVRRHGVKVIYVDYIQAVASGRGKAAEDRRIHIGQSAAAIKAQGQALGVSVVLLSQLTRAEKGKQWTEPYDGELKEAGELENMAEVIALVWETGDGKHRKALGKISKIKWASARPRFQLERDSSGSVTGLTEVIEDHHQPDEGHAWQTAPRQYAHNR